MSEIGIYQVASFVGSDGAGHNRAEQGRENRIAKGNRHIVLYAGQTSNKRGGNSGGNRGGSRGGSRGDSRGDKNSDQRKDRIKHELKQLSKDNFPDILVVLKANALNHYSADFFQNGHTIQRCGSGYLAAAHIVFESVSADAVSLRTPNGLVLLHRHKDQLSFKMSVLQYQPEACIKRWKTLLNKLIKNAVLVGGENDYCIIELKHEKDVKTCLINSHRLCQYSKRGLIVTAKSTQKKDDYVMRYFAPQYGQKEDAATGSANAMVGRYWQHRLQKQKVQGRQLSATGGEFIVEACGLQQRVMGRTRHIP